ncbi:hypothetical protein [Brucella sp. NBRC 113783]|uniref:hypothetical protein n=1 Tax=Brucella sp. NBRC 113783 TaxID=3075478 RepID=UPI0029C096E9|nr:hypothetical protein [Brucella sp. NBRC 113783]MDX4072538.1 hypothetical protein [Brucella sp. NBRC 113783]
MKKLSISEREQNLMMTASKRSEALIDRLNKSAAYKEAITKKQVTFKQKLEMAAN